MTDSRTPAGDLATELSRLVGRVRPWSFERWAARATGRDGSRSDAVYDLVLLLADRCPLTPVGTVPARLRDVALADQVAVVGNELTGWIEEHEDAVLAAEILAAVRGTRDAIESMPL